MSSLEPLPGGPDLGKEEVDGDEVCDWGFRLHIDPMEIGHVERQVADDISHRLPHGRDLRHVWVAG